MSTIDDLTEQEQRLIAADFAERVLPLFEAEYPDDDRPRKAIEAARAYARGEIVKIAEYNSHDVRATSAVYRKVRDLVLRYRGDWTAAKG